MFDKSMYNEVFIRSPGQLHIGRLESVSDKFIELSNVKILKDRESIQKYVNLDEEMLAKCTVVPSMGFGLKHIHEIWDVVTKENVLAQILNNKEKGE